MSKYSVKKPFTVLVGVIIIIILGIVSMVKMQLDLLPNISLPYLLVITTYPGASAEKVEAEVCMPMESTLGTINGIKNVYSISNENYGMVELEFQDDTNLDNAMVKVSAGINTMQAVLPEECGTPIIMEISTDMMASMYVAVGYDGKTMEEMSQFALDTVIPAFERLDGVANVNSLGLIEKSIIIELNKEKVDILNDKILAKTDKAFADALVDLDDARQKLLDSQDDLEKSKTDLVKSQDDLNEKKQDMIDGIKKWHEGKQELEDSERELNQNIGDISSAESRLKEAKDALNNKKSSTYDMLAKGSKALDELNSYQTQLLNQQGDLIGLDKASKGIPLAISGFEDLKSSIGSFFAQPPAGSEYTVEEISAIIGSLPAEVTVLFNQLNLSAAEIADRSQSDTILFLQGKITDKISELTRQKDSYQKEIDALNLEIEVTKSIISGYEAQLKATGMSYEEIEKAKMEAAAGFGSGDATLTISMSQIESSKKQLDNARDQINDAKDQLKDSWEQIESGYEQLEDGQEQIDEAWDKLKDGQDQINDGWDDYNDAVRKYEKQKIEAIKKANANQLLSLATLSQIIYAQNFEMPAGYVDDELDNSWLVKIGDNYKDVDELKSLELAYIDDIGDICINDVADVTVIDNSGETYTRLNGGRSVILSIFKSSAAGTNAVSRNCKEAIKNLTDTYPGLSVMTLVDQGDYITMIVKSVVQSMLLGAALAIIVLALFIKNVKPTIVVAISIPLSILASLVCMYFSNISLNMLSLSGIALGVGMLVDNSIVVIENIYRLRSLGVSAPRAAVYGTKQVSGAIISSTLTTICVFLPMLYTSGLVRDLMMPMCLTIIFTLLSSLLISLTVVPAAGSTVLKNTKETSHKLFDKILDVYGKILAFCLKVKVVPLTIAIVLLAFSVWMVIRMGIVMMPEMNSDEIQATLELPEELDRQECYEIADTVVDRMMRIDGIASVGIMAGNDTALISSAATGASEQFRRYSIMIGCEDGIEGSKEIKAITKAMEETVKDLDCTLSVSSGMSEMSQLTGSGLSINIYGHDLYKLNEISHDIMDEVRKVEGFDEITNGQEDADPVIHLKIDKNYAMSKGLTVAQIYQDIQSKLTLEKDAVKVTIDDIDMNIIIKDKMDPITYENLMDYGFTVNVIDEDDDEVTEDHPLSDFAQQEILEGLNRVERKNQSRYITVSASVKEGYNSTLLTRELKPILDKYELPSGYSLEFGGEYDSVVKMLEQMGLVIALGVAFIYLVMVAQFQSLLSPFIVLFTIPLAFTGGLFALLAARENLSVIAIMGFIVLMGTVVNNGIVFVDYANQLRKKGMDRDKALILTGKTRMRPILMTALTTILAESNLIFGDDMGTQMGKGMALVIAGGLAYATLMTLFIIPVMYDILFKKPPLDVDTGDENLDDIPDEAFIADEGNASIEPPKDRKRRILKRRVVDMDSTLQEAAPEQDNKDSNNDNSDSKDDNSDLEFIDINDNN